MSNKVLSAAFIYLLAPQRAFKNDIATMGTSNNTKSMQNKHTNSHETPYN